MLIIHPPLSGTEQSASSHFSQNWWSSGQFICTVGDGVIQEVFNDASRSTHALSNLSMTHIYLMEGFHLSHLYFRQLLASRHTTVDNRIIHSSVSKQVLQQKQTDPKQRRHGDI